MVAKRLFKFFPYISIFLSSLCLLTVLCFLFPEFLTTPEIRSNYPILLFRKILLCAEVIALGFGLVSIFVIPQNKYAYVSLLILSIALLLGGHRVPLKEEYDSFFIRLGLDWFVLDLFVLALIFVTLETLFPKNKEQKILRPEFRTDMSYFAVGHLGFQMIFLLTQKPINVWLEYHQFTIFGSWISNLPLVLQIFIALVISDSFQCTIHRLFHKSRRLWPFHKVHHSAKTMDWIAGSRLHLIDIIIVRSLIYLFVMYIGLSAEAFAGYLLVVALQTVFIHSNVGVRFGFLTYLITTPQYHHWHHNKGPETYDKNYAVHFPFIDMLMGTFYLPKDTWPKTYGVDDKTYPETYWGQFKRAFMESFKG